MVQSIVGGPRFTPSWARQPSQGRRPPGHGGRRAAPLSLSSTSSSCSGTTLSPRDREKERDGGTERGRRRLIITTFVANKTKSNLGSQIRVNRTICSIFLDVGVLL